MGEIRPKKCEGRELTKDQLAAGRAHDGAGQATALATPVSPTQLPSNPGSARQLSRVLLRSG